jgi:hypothetical protein
LGKNHFAAQVLNLMQYGAVIVVKPELCTSNTEKGNFIFNIGLLYFTNVFRSFTQKVKLIFDMFFRHLNPQGVADLTEFALLSVT